MGWTYRLPANTKTPSCQAEEPLAFGTSCPSSPPFLRRERSAEGGIRAEPRGDETGTLRVGCNQEPWLQCQGKAALPSQRCLGSAKRQKSQSFLQGARASMHVLGGASKTGSVGQKHPGIPAHCNMILAAKPMLLGKVSKATCGLRHIPGTEWVEWLPG